MIHQSQVHTLSSTTIPSLTGRGASKIRRYSNKNIIVDDNTTTNFNNSKEENIIIASSPSSQLPIRRMTNSVVVNLKRSDTKLLCLGAPGDVDTMYSKCMNSIEKNGISNEGRTNCMFEKKLLLRCIQQY